MKKRATKIAMLIICALLTFTAVPQPALARTGNTNSSVKVDGMKRKYYLHIPKSYSKTKSMPLVIVLHGAFAPVHFSRWDLRMNEQAEKDGFIVSYPCAAFGTWNAGYCCGLSKDKNVDDVSFISKMIEKLKQEYNIDSDRVYVAGFSNGGMMAYRLGKELSSEIAAISPIEACMYEGSVLPTKPLSVIAFNGTEDPVIPYRGGTGLWSGMVKLRIPPVSEAMKFWVAHDKCNQTPVCESIDKVTVERYLNGQNSTEVCLYTLDGGRHFWYGARMTEFAGKPQEKDFNVTDTMCKFFWEHPRRSSETASSEANQLVQQTPVVNNPEL